MGICQARDDSSARVNGAPFTNYLLSLDRIPLNLVKPGNDGK